MDSLYAKYLKILNRDKYTTKDVIVKMAQLLSLMLCMELYDS